jgi:putative redox protein
LLVRTSACRTGHDRHAARRRPQGLNQNVHFTVTGKALDPKRVEQAVHFSAEKYCSASIMLGKMAEITHDFEVVEG